MSQKEHPCRGLARVPRLDDLVERDRDHDCEGFGRHKICVKVESIAALPTRYGDFRVIALSNNRDHEEHIALVHGDVLGQPNVRSGHLMDVQSKPRLLEQGEPVLVEGQIRE